MLSAAEKRRQRAQETAHDLDAPSMFDDFGRGEKTGLGGRARIGDSVTRAADPRVPSHAYHLEESPQAQYARRGPPPISGVRPVPAPGYPSRAPSGLHDAAMWVSGSEAAHAPSAPPPRPAFAAPASDTPQSSAYDPHMFGDNASPARGHDGSTRLQRHQQRRLPALEHAPAYEPHPLEYDGGVPLPEHIANNHFGANGASPRGLGVSSRALDEYFTRTRGPILDDNDRSAIEDFFATDDFTEQFNARAAALRAAAAVARPAAGPSPTRPQLPPLDDVGDAEGPLDERYPLCHRCHQAVLAADRASRAPAPSGLRAKVASGPRTGRPSGKGPRKVPAMKPTTGRRALGR